MRPTGDDDDDNEDDDGVDDDDDETNRAMANLPQLEDYHILDRDDSHLLILSCHGLPEITFNGALVLSRSVMMMMMMMMM